jgi:hypothetical protein
MNYEKLLRQLRQSPKLWADNTIKIDRVLSAAKRRMLAQRERQKPEEPVGPYSGLTRGELRQSRTAEPDWF